MLKLITLAEYEANHTVTSSGDSTVDMYWLFVQYKLYNIVICKNTSFNAIDDAISDANWALRHIAIEYEYGDKTPILEAYRQQLLLIIKKLESLEKHS